MRKLRHAGSSRTKRLKRRARVHAAEAVCAQHGQFIKIGERAVISLARTRVDAFMA